MPYRDNLEKIAQIYEGVAIFSVEPGTTCHRAGVRAGDVLVAVNGRRVRQIGDYAAARGTRKETLELVVMRDGQQLRLWATHLDAGGAPGRAKGDSITCAWIGVG